MGTAPLSEGGLKIKWVCMSKICKSRSNKIHCHFLGMEIPRLTWCLHLVPEPRRLKNRTARSPSLRHSLAVCRFPECPASMVPLNPGGGRCYRRLSWKPALCGDVEDRAVAELRFSTTIYGMRKQTVWRLPQDWLVLPGTQRQAWRLLDHN